MDLVQTSSSARRVSTHAHATPSYHAATRVMGVKKGAEMAKPVTPEYQDISSDSDQDVHMYSGPMREEPRSVDVDSAISSCSGSPLTPSGCPFIDPASRFNERSPETTRPSVIVASANLDRNHVSGSPSSGRRRPLPPPDGVNCEIVTQPKPLMRFRYSSEYKDNRAAHKMVGQDSTTDRTTYPSLLIKGWNGPAVVVVSLVQAENYQQLHPHSLVLAECNKDTEQEGFVRRTVKCSSAGTLVLFNDLCLIRNKKESVVKLLPQRYRKIDPFGVGYQASDARSINSHAVRLCFEVYMDVELGFFRLPPVVSWVVRNSGAHQTLKILNLGFCPIRDNCLQEVMLLCDKVDKDDIEVEVVALERGKEILLQSHRHCEVHGQVAIIFKVPSVFLAADNDNTYVRLKRISTQDKSELYKFTPPRPILGHVAGSPTRSPGGMLFNSPYPASLEPPAMFYDHIPFATSHPISREPILGASVLDDFHRNTFYLRAANKLHSTIEPGTSAYSNSRRFENFSTKVYQQKKTSPKESPKDTFNDLNRLNDLTLNSPCQTTGHVNNAQSTNQTAYMNLNLINDFSQCSYPKNYENVDMAVSDQSPFRRNVFTEDRIPAPNIPENNLTAGTEANVLDDDKANGSSGEISDLISSETLRTVEKEVLGGINTDDLFGANEDKMST